MSKINSIPAATLAAVGLAVIGLQPASADAASPSLSTAAVASRATGARIAVHFDLAAGQTPENVALAPGGVLYVTFAVGRQVARIAPDGTTRILATLPAPADGANHTPVLGFPLTSGIVRDTNGTLYFLYATGTADLTGLWRLRPGGKPERIAALPPTGLPNGLALDRHTGNLYIADSVLGTIWQVPKTGGTPKAWSTAPELASTGFLGVNGVKLRGGAVWVTNLDKGTVLRIPIDHHQRAGQAQTRATGLAGIDDFEFTGRGSQIVAAIDSASTVVLIQPDGTRKTLLTAADGLQNPTSVAVRGNTAYVLSAAYVTQQDPNLVIAPLH
jgi:sugar lactone lactonase YvrE